MSLPTLIGVVLGSSLPDVACRCQVRGWLTCGFVSVLALSLELSGHPQAVGLEENALLSHPGPGMPQPSSVAPAPRQLVPQLEYTEVPGQQKWEERTGAQTLSFLRIQHRSCAPARGRGHLFPGAIVSCHLPSPEPGMTVHGPASSLREGQQGEEAPVRRKAPITI